MASELRVNTLKDAAGNNSIATSFVAGGSAKAWANVYAQTPTINDSTNIASITDNGTGDHSLSFVSTPANAYYAFPTSAHYTGGVAGAVWTAEGKDGQAQVSSYVRIGTQYSTGRTAYDTGTLFTVAILGDLA